MSGNAEACWATYNNPQHAKDIYRQRWLFTNEELDESLCESQQSVSLHVWETSTLSNYIIFARWMTQRFFLLFIFLNCKTFLVSWSCIPKVPCYVCKIQDVCVMYVATCFSLLLLLFLLLIWLCLCALFWYEVSMNQKKSTEMKRNKIYWNYYFKKHQNIFNSKTGLGLKRLHAFVLHHSLLLFGWFKLYLCVLWSVTMCPWTKKVKRTELNCTEMN